MCYHTTPFLFNGDLLQMTRNKTALSVSSITDVSEGKEILETLLTHVFRDLSVGITRGLEEAFKQYQPSDSDITRYFGEFLADRGDKTIRAAPMALDNFALLNVALPRSFNKFMMTTFTDFGLLAMRLLKKGPRFDQLWRSHNKWTAKDTKTIKEWVAALYEWKRTGDFRFFNFKPSDVLPEINDEFNDYVNNVIAPRVYRDLAEEAVSENSDLIIKKILEMFSKAVVSAKREIETNYAETQARLSKKAFLSAVLQGVRTLFMPSVKNMTKGDVLTSILKGIEDIDTNLQNIADELSAPDVKIVLESIKRISKQSLEKALRHYLIPIVRAKLNPKLQRNIKYF